MDFMTNKAVCLLLIKVLLYLLVPKCQQIGEVTSTEIREFAYYKHVVRSKCISISEK